MEYFSPEFLERLVKASLIFGFGISISFLARKTAQRFSGSIKDKQHSMLLTKAVFYVLMAITITSTLNQLGFNLNVLLGAAGIVTVAVGFASQTSASNLISGLFLLGERPFAVGDIITINTTTGEVISIDLLSVKLRTFDNLFVRIPNESIIKSEVKTLTRFPIRRYDLVVGVAYREDLDRVHEVLKDVAAHNPLCLDDPPPLFIMLGFGDSSINIQFSVWASRENFLELRNTMHIEIKKAFDANGIEIPFPHRSLYTGSMTEPFPVRVVAEKE